MHKDEILKIAKEKYPVGTVFKSAFDKEKYSKCVVKKTKF